MNMFRKIGYSITLTALVLIPAMALAANPPEPAVSGNPITLDTIENLVSTLLDYVITIASLLVVGYLIYAGFLMLSAGDDTAKFAKGKTALRNGIIGAAVVFGVGTILATIARFSTNPTSIGGGGFFGF